METLIKYISLFLFLTWTFQKYYTYAEITEYTTPEFVEFTPSGITGFTVPEDADSTASEHTDFTASEITEFTTPSMKIPGKYNESCEIDSDCDLNFQLKCTDGSCNCSQPDIMIFQNATGKCHVKWGESCHLRKNSAGIKPRISLANSRILDCVPNSKCGSNGLCACNSTFYEGHGGVCYPKGGAAQRCNSTLHCREDRGLFCNGVYCDCDRNNFLTRGREFGICEMQAGHGSTTRIYNVECVPNAYYNETTGKCKCKPKYRENKGFCIVPFGGECDDFNQPCASDMTCISGRCECYFTGKDLLNGTCYSKVGQPCMLSKGDMTSNHWRWNIDFYNAVLPCEIGAACMPSEDNSYLFECQCRSGYVEVDGECQLDYRRYCGTTPPGKCDQNRGLQCLNSYCECPRGKLQYFDSQLEHCRGLVGAPCKMPTGNDTAVFCTAGAHCAPRTIRGQPLQSRTTSQKEGYCKCMPEYRLNDDRTCIKR